MGNFFQHLRLKHWVKNWLIFIPALFGLNLGHYWPELLLAFLSFSLLASSVYLINDVADRKTDRYNPDKKGVITNNQTPWWMIGSVSLLLISLMLTTFLENSWQLIQLFLLYFFLNIFYSFKAKQWPYIEMIFVVSGFIIRLYFGSWVSATSISNWLLAEVILISFLVILMKRIREMKLNAPDFKARPVLNHYSLSGFKTLFTVCVLVINGVYILYCFAFHTVDLPVIYPLSTAFLVALGSYRIIQLTHQKTPTLANPVALFLSDIYLLSLSALWMLIWVILLYAC